MLTKVKLLKKASAKRYVCLNEIVYTLTESKYNEIIGFNKPMKKRYKIFDREAYQNKHQKTCDKIRKYGKYYLTLDQMWRDD